MSDSELDMLETWLDGELPADEARDLQVRLAGDAALAEALSGLRRERELRSGYFEAIEPQEAELERVAGRLHAGLAQRRRQAWYRRFARTAGAIAACAAIGFAVGWIGRGGMSGTTSLPRPQRSYQVNIADETGRIIGTQRFDSVEQAREFSEDLHRWQQQQEQLRNGHVIVRSASF